jgi:hypothetical protein
VFVRKCRILLHKSCIWVVVDSHLGYFRNHFLSPFFQSRPCVFLITDLALHHVFARLGTRLLINLFEPTNPVTKYLDQHKTGGPLLFLFLSQCMKQGCLILVQLRGPFDDLWPYTLL